MNEKEDLKFDTINLIRNEIKSYYDKFISRKKILFICFTVFKKYYKISKKYVETRFRVEFDED
jgi:hypothetical protein